MDGFCLLYLLLLLLMRSGDVETNPGPDTSERYAYTGLLRFIGSSRLVGSLRYTTFRETKDHVKMHVQDAIFLRFALGLSHSVM